jgi:para-nitrobenzyl esterase
VPVIVGNNAREQPAPAPDALRKAVTDTYGINAEKALAFYGLTAPGPGNDDPLYGPAGIQFTADTRYRCGAVAEAFWHTAAGNTVYEYQFDHAIAGRPATQHSAEVPYVFGNLLPGGFLGGPYVDQDHRISGVMQQYWTHFAKTGDPNGPGLPKWPKFDAKTRAFLEFTDSGPVAGAALRQSICDLYIENLKHELHR